MGRIDASEVERCTRIFQQMDLDGTGFIDAADLR